MKVQACRVDCDGRGQKKQETPCRVEEKIASRYQCNQVKGMNLMAHRESFGFDVYGFGPAGNVRAYDHSMFRIGCADLAFRILKE